MEAFDPRAGITTSPSASDNGSRRKAGRLEAEMLVCQHGPVVDLSSGGMRVLCRRVPAGEKLDIELVAAGELLRMKARVAWSRRIGLFKHEVGFQFLDVTPELARKLTAIATTGRMRRTV